jgi:hypothetical protein
MAVANTLAYYSTATITKGAEQMRWENFKKVNFGMSLRAKG